MTWLTKFFLKGLDQQRPIYPRLLLRSKLCVLLLLLLLFQGCYQKLPGPIYIGNFYGQIQGKRSNSTTQIKVEGNSQDLTRSHRNGVAALSLVHGSWRIYYVKMGKCFRLSAMLDLSAPALCKFFEAHY